MNKGNTKKITIHLFIYNLIIQYTVSDIKIINEYRIYFINYKIMDFFILKYFFNTKT